jgi:hypothetical protein
MKKGILSGKLKGTKQTQAGAKVEKGLKLPNGKDRISFKR